MACFRGVSRAWYWIALCAVPTLGQLALAQPAKEAESTEATPPAAPETAAPAPRDRASVESGPELVLASEDSNATPAASVAPGVAESERNRTTIGGYAQLNLNSVRRGSAADFETTATVRRLVLLVMHELSDDILTSAELEWENATACSTCSGAVEVEQAYVDWTLVDRWLTFRSGLVLVPMGLVNQWHEPPVFNGVERPTLDTNLIPTTWRELGLGVLGHVNDFSYEAYLLTTFSPSELGPAGLVGASHLGSNTQAEAAAVALRFDYEPFVGLELGVSGYGTNAGGNGDYFTQDGEQVDLSFPILGADVHARYHRRGVEAKAVGVVFAMPEAGALMHAYRPDGVPYFPNADRTGAVPTRMQGGYLELGYDVLAELPTTHRLVPFARVERVDDQAAVPDGFRKNGALRVDELTVGLSYLPIRQLVFKADTQWSDRQYGLDELRVDAGLGYMY
jgi:hypothetical protein